MIDLSGKIINNTYIIKTLIFETKFIQRWEVNAIFSPNSFFFDLVKDKESSDRIYANKNTLSDDLAKYQGIRNAHLLKTIEFGMYEEHFFTVQQKITEISLAEAKDLNFKDEIIISMMDKLGQCLLSFEWRGLSHNLLSADSIWVPTNQGNIGILYINDTFLSYELIYSGFPLDSHFKSPPSCYCSSFYQDGKYHPGISNDLFAFGSIFYKLMTLQDPFEAETFPESLEKQNSGNIDLTLIENQKIRDFISCFFDDRKQFKTVEEMYGRFEKVFLNELSGKDIERSRENTSSQDSLDAYYMDSSDETTGGNTLDVVEEVLTPPGGKTGTPKKKKVKSIVNAVVKTVFGFFRRFRRGRPPEQSLKGSAKEKARRNSRAPHAIKGDLPSGDLGYSSNNPDPERLKQLYKELSSHFSDLDSTRKTNATMDIEAYNNANRQMAEGSPLTSPADKIDTIRATRPASESVIIDNKENGTEPMQNENRPMLDYLLEKTSYVNEEYREIKKKPSTPSSGMDQPLHTAQPLEKRQDMETDETEKEELVQPPPDEAKEEKQTPPSEEQTDEAIQEESIVEAATKKRKKRGIWSAIRHFFLKFLQLFK